jgi:hypothetical protein
MRKKIGDQNFSITETNKRRYKVNGCDFCKVPNFYHGLPLRLMFTGVAIPIYATRQTLSDLL